MSAYNGSGVFTLTGPEYPAVAASLIQSAYRNALDSAIATGLSTAICRDGQSVITANIPFNGFKITGIGAAAARTDAASLATIQDATGVYVAIVGGTANAITLTPTPSIAAYAAGQRFQFIASGTNSTTVVVDVSSLGAKLVTKHGTTSLVSGDILSGALVQITYDGTRFQLDYAIAMTQAEIGLTLYPQTAAELSAGVTPTAYQYAPGDSRRYNVLSDGATNNATALQNMVNSVAGTGLKAVINLLGGSGAINVGSAVTLASATDIEVAHGVSIVSTLAGGSILKGDDVSNISINGGTWTGKDNTTAIDGGDGGLIYIDNRGTANGNIRIRNTKVNKSGTAGISCLHVEGLWVDHNEVSDCADYCVLAGRSADFHIDHNYLHDSAEAGAANTYGVSATGADASGEIEQRCSISFNKIVNFASWDGIMCHDVTKLVVIGNVIENVRIGVDISCSTDANVISEIVVADNIIHLTSTDNWAAASAAADGIHLVGRAAAPIKRASVTGNIVRNAFGMVGATYAANSSAIRIEECQYSAVTGNVVQGIGANGASRFGILITGAQTVGTVVGNIIEGDPTNAIRTSGMTSSALSITGNSILLTTVGNTGIMIGSGTHSNLFIGGNATNSTVPYNTTGGPTITKSGRVRVNGLTIEATASTITTAAGEITIGSTHAGTVGAAGGASALPATPTGYLIVNIDGTAQKIPYYAN